MIRRPVSSTSTATSRQRVIEGLGPGLSHLIFHPAKDSAELRALAPDWEARVQDYELCLDARWRRFVEASGAKVVGYRELRDAARVLEAG